MNSPTPTDSPESETWLSEFDAAGLALLTAPERLELNALLRSSNSTDLTRYADDPVGLAARLWPHVRFYGKQVEIIESVRDNDETFVPAAHQVGKDFVTGYVVLWFFLTRHPCRVITTSVKDDHLRVLWGEIGRFIDASVVKLRHRDGGSLIVNHREIRKVLPHGQVCPISYTIGMVSESGEGMQGHHAAHTLLIVDEASGVSDLVYERADTWAKKKLFIGNPYPCNNFFFKGVKGGDLLAPPGCDGTMSEPGGAGNTGPGSNHDPRSSEEREP